MKGALLIDKPTATNVQLTESAYNDGLEGATSDVIPYLLQS